MTGGARGEHRAAAPRARLRYHATTAGPSDVPSALAYWAALVLASAAALARGRRESSEPGVAHVERDPVHLGGVAAYTHRGR